MNEENELLRLFIAKRDEIGAPALAEILKIKNASTVRMICGGHYPNPEHILKRFAAQFINVVACPYAGRDIERTECQHRSEGARPFGGASKQAWWDACQTCQHKGGK